MTSETYKIPDIGGATDVDVIEISVAVGDTVEEGDSIIVLESDKASMDVPAPVSGTIKSVLVSEGDKVSEGEDYVVIESASSGKANADSGADTSADKDVQDAAPAKPIESGMSSVTVAVPDIGGAEDVDVIEVCVAVGDSVDEGDSLIVLESDKASMEVPSPSAGKVEKILIKEGDKASEGTAVLVLAVSGGAADVVSPPEPASDTNTLANTSAALSIETIAVPDLGGAEDVEVIEVCVSVGEDISEGDSLIVLESDKASMEVPAPSNGKIVSIAIKEGDKVSMGALIGEIESQSVSTDLDSAAPAKSPEPSAAVSSPNPSPAVSVEDPVSAKPSGDVYAGPAVRKLARQMGVDLSEVSPSGPRGRVQKDDVKAFVKKVMAERSSGGGVASGSGIPPIPEVDFSQFGPVELVKMSKIKKVTAINMSRNWLNVPHVTQFDDADITELEAFRKNMKADAEKAGVKLTPVPFILKACAAALRAEPSFNVSLHADGEHIVQKDYVHIGVAVDTPKGLMVPVIRDVDKKGLFQLADETIALAKKARDGKLLPREMQGGCFTISSLGAIGGQGFTPIVSAPEVAILGVSRAEMKPKWNGAEFQPRLMLPLSLSYDHRAINGGDAGRFFTQLNAFLADVRRLLL